MYRIAAIYTTYNPDLEHLIKSISILSPQVYKIYIVDNSPVSNLDSYNEICTKFSVNVISTDGNTGIADALNLGCNRAWEDGIGWCITMDQDSIVSDDIVQKYLGYLNMGNTADIGALVPSFTLCPGAKKITGGKTQEVRDYMTSGSIIRLSAFIEIGGFNKDLFIDMVDTEFGLKLRKAGYRIVRLKDVFMEHNIGNAKEITLLGRHIAFVTHHNYIRRYYITRNVLWLATNYGKQFPQFNRPYWMIFKSIIRIMLFENDKTRKIQSIIKGIKDYRRNHYGKYSPEITQNN